MPVGVFVADGTGAGGTVSGATLRVGSGSGGALRLLLLFVFAFAFAFALATGLGSSISSGDTFAFAFTFTLAGGLTVPPAGNPSSAFPLAGCVGCTG